jgi:hypothetical protein
MSDMENFFKAAIKAESELVIKTIVKSLKEMEHTPSDFCIMASFTTLLLSIAESKGMLDSMPNYFERSIKIMKESDNEN